MRRVALVSLVPLALVGLYLIAAIAGALWPGPVSATFGDDGRPHRIGLIVGPIHTDLLLPLDPALRQRLAFAAAAGVPVDDPRAEWLIVGWGSRAFYTATGTYADLSASTVWQAATGDAAVLRLDTAGPIPPDAPGVDWLELSPARMAALTTTILATFAGHAALHDAGFTATDAFFPAHGRFDLFNTCNVWIADALRAAGQPFGAWTPTPFAIRMSLWRFASEGPSAAP